MDPVLVLVVLGSVVYVLAVSGFFGRIGYGARARVLAALYMFLMGATSLASRVGVCPALLVLDATTCCAAVVFMALELRSELRRR